MNELKINIFSEKRKREKSYSSKSDTYEFKNKKKDNYERNYKRDLMKMKNT